MSTMSANFLFSKAFRWVAVATIAPWMFLDLVYPVQAAPSATLTGISQGKFNCMKQNTANGEGRIDYSRGNRGTIGVFSNVWGQVGTFNFNFVPSTQRLTVTWVSGAVTTERLRDGLQNTASNTCKNIP